ncbi:MULTISPECIES: hypothetical protein [unclassified Actinomadura]|uniref:hypothetical protein n=1 Tax=unclassified Actinomadura TaxID=2626254 RepID=UPI0011EE96B2|nr:hypothetical protein [Actinomadura sp. K4S16]
MAVPNRFLRRVTAGGVVLALLAGCGGGPASRKDLCDAYGKYQKEVSRPHFLSNKGVFDALRDLGDTAERYEGNASVRQAGPALKKMGESDSYRPMEAEYRALPIRAECRTG